MGMIIKCIICEKEFDVDITSNKEIGNIYGGIRCHSSGNYGSSVFDPINGYAENEYLEFCICDECLKEKAKLVKLIQIQIKHEIIKCRTFDEKLKET